MTRRRLPWLVAMPTIAAGSIAGHAIGSRLVIAHAPELVGEAGQQSGLHLPPPPIAIGFVGALLFGGALLLIRSAKRGRGSRSTPPWLFLAMPVAAWLVQEGLERLGHAEAMSLHAMLDPSLFLGMALQIPFGIAAFFLAYLLLGALVRACAALSGDVPRVGRPSVVVALPIGMPGARRTRVVALRRAQRAPPRLLPAN